jgi:hypothetical protein
MKKLLFLAIAATAIAAAGPAHAEPDITLKCTIETVNSKPIAAVSTTLQIWANPPIVIRDSVPMEHAIVQPYFIRFTGENQLFGATGEIIGRIDRMTGEFEISDEPPRSNGWWVDGHYPTDRKGHCLPLPLRALF